MLKVKTPEREGPLNTRKDAKELFWIWTLIIDSHEKHPLA
jgi:hypothetical protein